MNQRVSVIIPCYNGEKTIDQAIESVYSQSYTDTELIVVDDGSTDRSKEKILAWQDVFYNAGLSLLYVYQENKGPGGAINTGLKYVTGKYLTLLDADDRYLPGSIQKRVDCLEADETIAVVRTNGWTVNGDNRWLFVQSSDEMKDEDVFSALIFGKTNNWAGSYMVRTKQLFRFYPDREILPSRFGQNLQILLPVTYKQKCAFINEPLMEYVRQPESLTAAVSESEAKRKENRNADGYRDIFLRMIDAVVDDPAEKEYYITGFYRAFYKRAISRALICHDWAGMREGYQKLKEYTTPDIDDKIVYFSLLCPAYAYVLRVLRKLNHLYKNNGCDLY